MKTFHTLKARWLLTAMLAAVVVGETIAWQISEALGIRFDPTAVAAVCVGAVAVVVAAIYDGRD